MGELNLEVLTLEDLDFLFDEYNVQCVIICGHVKELLSNN